MEFGLGTYSLGFLAGLLSTLSPCVLPLIPILLATATGNHKYGPLALATGLMLSFTLIGTLVAFAGPAVGIDQIALRNAGAVVLVLFGSVLLSAPLQARFATATAGISAAGDRLLSVMHIEGLRGQLLVGLVLGIVWSPCVGPTLGAAIALASQGSHLPQITLLMAFFGLGAGVPLLLLGFLSRNAMQRIRGRLLNAGKYGKLVMGLVLIALAMAILTGADKGIETWAVDHSPEWLTELTTRY